MEGRHGGVPRGSVAGVSPRASSRSAKSSRSSSSGDALLENVYLAQAVVHLIELALERRRQAGLPLQPPRQARAMGQQTMVTAAITSSTTITMPGELKLSQRADSDPPGCSAPVGGTGGTA